MSVSTQLDLGVVESRVCDIAAECLFMPRDQVLVSSRMIEDLRCDSLELIELFMELEDEFHVTIPHESTDPVTKCVFTRRPFILGDLAEIVYLQQGSGKPNRSRRTPEPVQFPKPTVTFSQLGGRWRMDVQGRDDSFESLECDDNKRRYRRRSDGMTCVLIPSAQATIGSDDRNAQADEQPSHTVQLSSFLMDQEPVSTMAFCRFLNSITATEAHWLDWFQLDPIDDRSAQMPIELADDEWRPVAGAETIPMVLVSWFGANAYSLWANGSRWEQYDIYDGFLPSEAQWEYAAQGAFRRLETSEDEPAFVFGQHQRGNDYEASTMPIAPVHIPAGVSKFGLHHMAGNVWQWCCDWYVDDFYRHSDSRGIDPVNAHLPAFVANVVAVGLGQSSFVALHTVAVEPLVREDVVSVFGASAPWNTLQTTTRSAHAQFASRTTRTTPSKACGKSALAVIGLLPSHQQTFPTVRST